ncbi:ATP-dependent helicase [Oleidesulfovibrio sp.]|uniref:ATP-dependent helicase n=1 Tax=Oleidesulfovibrio sp. TaxID=2909707 RepID=UPI003A8AC292
MIDYKNELNPAQYEAATTLEGPMLVIAGAGSGKTRTVVYRLANMVEQGISASNILLLTFTRKAAQEMQNRAAQLLGQSAAMVGGVQGGTFHAFAYSILRMHKPDGYEGDLSVMDSADAAGALKHCKDMLSLGKGDRSFPKTQTVMGLLSKARNKELTVEDVLRREAFHLASYAGDLSKISESYRGFKRKHSLMDYDDLLFELERLLKSNPELLEYYRDRFKYIMVDEFQDTNLVQARLVRLLGGGHRNVMAVGDDAQSIYAFRGANVQNILDFPDMFPGTKIVKLEENYRSVQPVLNLTNAILDDAPQAFHKKLFTRREGGQTPHVMRPLSDLTQASMVTSKVSELLRTYPPEEIAVLFRAGYQSYHVEMQLGKLGVKFKKYGGVRYADAAHVKDVLSYIRLVVNPLDLPAFQRMASLVKGIGAKTCLKLYEAAQKADRSVLHKACARYPELQEDFKLLEQLRTKPLTPAGLTSAVIEHYQPRLEANYPDDYPRRQHGLEQLVQIAASYNDVDLMLSDLCLEDPTTDKGEDISAVTLSTIHSAKGLEWAAVLLIDLVEDRFPSRHAMNKAEDFEEERRLMYVACTRARDYLGLFVPATIYDRSGGGNTPANPSPFVRDLPDHLYEDWRENFTGTLTRREASMPSFRPAPAYKSTGKPAGAGAESATGSLGNGGKPASGYCTHKIFGKGKIIQHVPPDKYRVNFPGFGLKVIMAQYLTME